MSEERQRTIQQNKALHLYCTMLSDALNDAGLDMKATLKPEIDIPWTPANVKDNIWKPVQEAMIKKRSTKDMDTVDPSKIYETINRHMAEKFGVSVRWPSRS